MRKFRNHLFALLSAIIVISSFSACAPEEQIDLEGECYEDQNQMIYESKSFNLGCYVKNKDGNPAESLQVTMKIWIRYCEGNRTLQEFSNNQDLTDSTGYWFSGLYTSFEYTNKKDVVVAEFHIVREGSIDFYHTEEYRWEDVENEQVGYVTIILPINEGEAPLADFIASDTSISIDQSVNFSDESTNLPTNWEWDFGDGNTSSIQNPSHTFNDTGSYTISLKAANDFGSGIETKEDYIIVSTVAPAPVADFYASEVFIDVGQSLTFYDQSSNSPTSWQWDFGDGNTSAVQNPSHSYDNSGSYTISLTATNASGSDTETKEDYIVVEAVPCVGFSYQGQNYNAVLIGDQCWMKENMNYETDNSWCYDDDPANCAIYGRLYTWEAALNVCPSGWHLPTSLEYGHISSVLGGNNVAGGKMKEEGTEHWNSPNTGATNESGFTALPGGYRIFSSAYYTELGGFGRFWTSSPSIHDELAKYRMVRYDNVGMQYNEFVKTKAISVRCVRD